MSDEVQTSILGLDQLATALCKAQAAMGEVPKSGINPAFKSADKPKGTPFSTLADVIGAIRKPLTDNGLSFLQPVARNEHGVAVTTVLLHVSGQRYSSTLEMPCGANANAQAVGSAISYGRRYSLLSMMGLASDDDDDGNAAVQAHRDEPRSTRTVTPHAQRNEPATAQSGDEKALDAELAKVVKAVLGYLPEQSVASLRKMFGLPDAKQKLTVDQKQIFLRSLQSKLRSLEDPPPSDDMPTWASETQEST